ncbi:hypothetical protein L596_029368 [Steinernema carpocapsae]|uniref:Uncharacterized protein n=1 Tax=Steinernema carpocapsae TaxID=34508 RepID=A0A4U5LUF1_STECR|nr:hypothetical protein L596_029368 [Steinernema carpocapsae]
MVAPSVAVDQIVAFLTRAVLTARARAKEECVERDVVELNAMYVALLREVGYVYEARCPTHMDCPTTDQCYLKLQYAKCLHVVRCVSAVLQTLFSNVSTLELSPVFSLNIFDALISRARMEIKRNYEHRCVKPEAPRHIKNVMTSVYLYQIPEDQVAQQLEEDLKQKLTNLKPCSASLDFYKEAAVKDHDVLYQTIVHFILVINKLLKQSSLQEEEPKEEIVQEAQMFWNNLRDTVFSKRLDEVDWFSVFDPGNLQVDLIEKLDNQVWNVFLCIYEGDVRSVLEANRMILKAILTALLDVLRAKCGMVSQKNSWSLSPTSPQYQIPGNNHSNAYVMIELELQSVADMLFIMRQTRNGFGLKVNTDVVQNEPQTVEQRDDEEDNEEIDNLLDKVAKLEEEKDDVVNEYTSKLRIANEQLKYEEQYKKKLLEEIMNMREMNEQTVAALKQSEEERITQIKTQHVAELKKLKDEHYNEMEEDKYAMK